MSTPTASMNGNGRVTAEILDRQPPWSQEAERSVIGSVILDPARFEDVAFLKSTDFYDRRHGILFRHLAALHRAGAIDATLLLERLRESGELAQIGGPADVLEITQAVQGPAHAAHYAKIVKDRSLKRALIRRMTEGLQEVYSDQSTGETLLQRHRGELERLEDGVEVAERFPTMTAAQLAFSEIHTEFIIPRVLVAGQAKELVGPMKSLKTSLLIDLGLSVATATPFLRHFDVPEALPVVIMSAESGLAKIKGTLHRTAYAAGIDLSGVSNLHLTASVPHFADMVDMDALGRMLRSRETAVLIVDPLYFCLDGDNQGNLSAQGAQLRAVNEVCLAENVTLILCHHTQKATLHNFEPLDLSAISGAGHGEFARQWTLMSRRSPYKHDGFHEMWMVIGGSEGHGGCWAMDVDEGHPDDPGGRRWDVVVKPAEDARNEARDREQGAREAKRDETQNARIEADSKRIVNVLVKYPAGETKRVIRDAAGLPGTRFSLALSNLLSDGDVVPCDVLKGNRETPFEGYRLKDE